MAKPSKNAENRKIVFGVRRKGKHQKNFGPKASARKKKYRGQGR